ncbi:MAG TPA: cytochrome c oxidase accessory protein CcoG [Chromobacteriaceae bacterium]|nr:cytochrome c oxidase accessory protein CcoG [Chromobacteriaceae bacterium]
MATALPPSGKIHPRLTSGRFNTIRVSIVLLSQLVYFLLPWLSWNHRPAVLFDLDRQIFYVFGAMFWPQDFVFLAAILVLSALGLFLWTALAGRLWCGYACPQTVYTQIMIWIERFTLGDHKQRQRLAAAPTSLHKALRLGLTHGVMIGFSLLTGFTLVAYFTPAPQLLTELLHNDLGPWQGFWLLFYAGFTYLLAGFLREKVCTHMCPYARFQGAMFDRNTLIISYDANRGEPRGPQRKQADSQSKAGHCIDCGICVQVCPTGIDIRQGLQYTCIGCAACIDACDNVMDKIGAPRGLIRYTSEATLEQQLPEPGFGQRLRQPRVLFYLLLVGSVLALSLMSLLNRPTFKADIMRDRASLVRETNDGWLENSYSIRLTNATEAPQRLALGVEGLPGIRLADGPRVVTLPPTQTITLGVRAQVEPQHADKGAHDIHFVVRSLTHDGVIRREQSSFIGE